MSGLFIFSFHSKGDVANLETPIWDIGAILNSTGLRLGVECFAYDTFQSWEFFCACLEVVWRLEHRTFYISA